MDISLRLYKGIVHIPTSCCAEGRFYVADMPLEAAPVEQTEELQQAIFRAIGRGNPPITRDQAGALIRGKDDPLLKAIGARSWYVVDRETKGLWGIIGKDGVYQIRVDQPMRPRGWHEDKTKRVEFPPGTSIDDVIERVIAMIQECARQ